MGSGGSGGVSAGVAGGSQDSRNLLDYLGDAWGFGGMNNPLSTAAISSLDDYRNSGALSDMLLGGRGFGKSRLYRQYNPVDPQYGYQAQTIPGYNSGPSGGASNGPPGKPPAEYETPGKGAGQNVNSTAQVGGGPGADFSMDSRVEVPSGASGGQAGGLGQTNQGGRMGSPQPPAYSPGGVGTRGGGTPGPMGPGQWDNGAAMGDPKYYDSLISQAGQPSNEYWQINDDAPVPGQGLLGDIENYGAYNDIDNRLAGDLGWQAGGDLMDLENQEKGLWDQFGKQNRLESATEDAIGWQRSGDLSDLEQQEKWGWNDVKGPGQYDQLRGDTLTGMVKNPGLSASEKASRLGAQTLPVQQALEAQQRQGDIRQAATGNAAGRWGASNAAALGAAAQNAQAGRDVETAAADYMRKDRAEGLGGLGSLQGQIDARKVQGVTGLGNLASKQRANQQFGIQSGLGLNEQQRGAQSQAAQGIGNLGQRQRANTQWGLGALSDFNKGKSDQNLAKIGLTQDMYKTQLDQGNKSMDRLGQLASLLRGGSTNTDSQSANIGVST